MVPTLPWHMIHMEKLIWIILVLPINQLHQLIKRCKLIGIRHTWHPLHPSNLWWIRQCLHISFVCHIESGYCRKFFEFCCNISRFHLIAVTIIGARLMRFTLKIITVVEHVTNPDIHASFFDIANCLLIVFVQFTIYYQLYIILCEKTSVHSKLSIIHQVFLVKWIRR